MSVKKSYSEIKEFIEKEGYTLLSTDYIGNKEKLEIKCPVGHIFNMSYNIFQSAGNRCPVCGLNARKESLSKNRYTKGRPLPNPIKYYNDNIDLACGDEYIRVSDFKGHHKKFLVKHISCGTTFEVLYSNFVDHGTRCPKCFRSFKKTTEEFIKDIENVHGKNEFEVLEDYKGNNKNIKVRHKCGYEYSVRPAVLTNLKCGCPKCKKIESSKKLKNKGLESFNNFLKDVKPEYIMIGEYNGHHNFTMFKHILCGYEFESKPYYVKTNATPCPKCRSSKGYSEKEVYLKNFIKILTSTKDDKKIGRKEVDILTCENIGIEFDGLYWHSTARNDNKHNLLEKTEFFKSHNIPVIHIFEDEWDNQQDTIKNRLSDILLNNTQYIQDPNNPNQLIPFTNEIQSDQIIIDRRWFITDKDILAAGYHLKETLPPKEFFLTNSCDIRYSEKSEDTRFSIFDCGYLVYEK